MNLESLGFQGFRLCSVRIKIRYFNGNRRALRVGASHKNPTRRWRYKNKTIVLFLMDSSITAFSALGTHADGELPHHGQGQILNLCNSRFFLAKAQKEIEIIPITPNCFRSKLPNLNLYEILSFCSADFHAFSSFCMSQSKEKRMSQRI